MRFPQRAKARIERLLDRLDLVLKLIDQVEVGRDAVLRKDAPADEAERMIRSLTDLRPWVRTSLRIAWLSGSRISASWNFSLAPVKSHAEYTNAPCY